MLGLLVLLVRRNVPESPRWLFIHGREEEAERIVGEIEDEVREETGEELEKAEDELTVRQRTAIPFREIAKVSFTQYRSRAVLGLALFIGQAFIYNGVTFDLGTLLHGFYNVSSSVVPLFIAIWAVSNFLGPLTLGRLFDTVGRKPMISGTYIGSGLVAVGLAVLVVTDTGGRWLFLAVLCVAFFLASSGASAAYLTVSEIFPMETRALAIAFYYALGTAIGGISGPLLFGNLIGSGERSLVAIAFYVGAGVMILGGITEIFLGVKSEQANLEDIAKPLTAEDAQGEGQEPEDAQGGDEQSEGGDRDRGSADREARRAPEPYAGQEALRERIQERRHRRQQQAASTRLRPGPGSTLYSPRMSTSTPTDQDPQLDREIEAIAAAVHEHGRLETTALARTLRASLWGPGRFRAALREAIAEGRVERVSSRVVGPPHA